MDRQKNNILASKSGANYYTKHLDGYSHLVVMLYAVLSNLRSLREVCDTYRRRWTIESIYKKLKQNFPLKYFLGDNVNAIEIQIWVTMIAYLLLRVVQVKSMNKQAFSNIVMLTRMTLGAYINIITLLNCSKLDWNLMEQQRARWVMNQNIRQLNIFGKQEGLLLDTRT